MQYGSFFSVLHPSSIYPLSHARLLQKCFNFFLAHPGPAVRINQYNSGSGPQRVQTVLFQVFDIWSVSTLRLLLITVAIMASRVSVPAVGPAAPGLGCPATRRLCVCQVHRNRPTVQPVPVSQSGCGPAPYCCFQAVPCSQTGSGKSKLMSGPVTSWPEQGAARDPRPTSDISQKEPCVGNVFLSVYIPCFIIIYHRRVHAGGLMVKASGWYA